MSSQCISIGYNGVWNETRIYENFRSYVVCLNHNLTFKKMFGAISHLFNLTFGNRISKLSLYCNDLNCSSIIDVVEDHDVL